MKSYFQKLFVAGAVLACATTTASAQLLYSANGWEAAGGPPNWTLASIATSLSTGQNGWVTSSTTVAAQHLVVGSTTLGSLTVTPRTGSRMHQSISSNRITAESRWTWVDLSGAWNGRTAGNNTVLVSMDCFLPSSSAASSHRHGIDSYDPTGNNLGGWMVQNNARAAVLFDADDLDSYSGTNILSRDAWTHFDFVLDFDAGRAELFINGVKFAGVTDTGDVLESVRLAASPFGDADLFNFNDPSQPTASNFFTDNYRVSAVHTRKFNGKIRLQDIGVNDAQSPVAVHFVLQNQTGTPVNSSYFVALTPDTTGDPTLGKYSVRMHDVAPGNYRLFIKGTRHLSRVVNVTVSGSGDVTVPTVTLKGGDANDDDSTDVLDLDQLIRAFDSFADDGPEPGDQPSANWDPGADFNYDDSVDVLDLDILIRNFDQTGDGA